jgi:hypothetical protein
MSTEEIKKEEIKKKETKKENIFDLSKLAPIELDHEIQKSSSIITIDEQVKLLVGFNELPKSDWGTLKMNDFIRYLRKDGSFRRGGYFKNAWSGTYGKNNGKECIQLSSSKSFKGNTWSVCHDDIDKIWKNANTQIKGASVNNTSNNGQESKNIDPEILKNISKNQESIEYMTKSMEQIKIDILKINNEQKRIINLIKKLHGIHSTK